MRRHSSLTPSLAALAALAGLGPAGERLPAAPAGRNVAAVGRRYSTEAWSAAADRALGRKRPALKPGGLIFPAVDERGKVRPDGRGISHMALVLATFPPARRLGTSVGIQEEVFGDAGCRRTQATLDPDTIRLCRRAADARWHVVPKLNPRARGYELTVSFHGDGAGLPDREARH